MNKIKSKWCIKSNLNRKTINKKIKMTSRISMTWRPKKWKLQWCPIIKTSLSPKLQEYSIKLFFLIKKSQKHNHQLNIVNKITLKQIKKIWNRKTIDQKKIKIPSSKKIKRKVKTIFQTLMIWLHKIWLTLSSPIKKNNHPSKTHLSKTHLLKTHLLKTHLSKSHLSKSRLLKSHLLKN